MWSSPSRCESTAGIPAHHNPFAALLNIPENVACTRAASQLSEVSPVELSVADQIRLCHDRDGHPSYNTHLRMYMYKCVLLHLARTPIVQVNAYRIRAITQKVSRNPRTFWPQPQHARPSSALAVPRAKGGFQIPLVRLHAWPVRVSQTRRS